MPHLETGKIPSDILVHSVFGYKGARDPSVILGSSIGEDAALVSFGKKDLGSEDRPSNRCILRYGMARGSHQC